MSESPRPLRLVSSRNPQMMTDRYPCPECGNDDTERATADPTMRVCHLCNYAWRLDGTHIRSNVEAKRNVRESA